MCATRQAQRKGHGSAARSAMTNEERRSNRGAFSRQAQLQHNRRVNLVCMGGGILMKGHIRQRGERSFELKFDAGRGPATGKRKVQYHSFKGTKREAQIKLAALIASVGKGTYVEPQKVASLNSCVRASINGKRPATSQPGRPSAIDNWSRTRSCRTSAQSRCRSSLASILRDGTRRCVMADLQPAPLAMRTVCCPGAYGMRNAMGSGEERLQAPEGAQGRRKRNGHRAGRAGLLSKLRGIAPLRARHGGVVHRYAPRRGAGAALEPR